MRRHAPDRQVIAFYPARPLSSWHEVRPVELGNDPTCRACRWRDVWRGWWGCIHPSYARRLPLRGKVCARFEAAGTLKD